MPRTQPSFNHPVTVLKFGSSVLRSTDHIPAIVNEIYRFVRRGDRVIAVVSAIGDSTETLLRQAESFGPGKNAAGVAALLSTGESTSAALVELGLDRAGLRATSLCAQRLRLRTRGPRHDAEPHQLDVDRVVAALHTHQVVVVPGFVGVHEDDGPSLLGRGGSDLTALFLADRLDAQTCRLVKDVDGLYEHDPNSAGELPRRYAEVSFDDALELDASIVQRKAIEFARQRSLPFEVGCIATTAPTVVGHGPSVVDHLPEKPEPLRIGLAGFGTVGYGVYEQLISQPERFEIVGIAVRRRARHLGRGVDDNLLTDDSWELFDRGIDVLIEVIGGLEPAADLIESALEAGVDVVTANKDVIARRGPDLRRVASRTGARLQYGGAVGGALPAVESVRRVAEAQPVVAIEGVLNGTCNFIIDAIRDGAEFDEAVRLAQRAGFAEADPSTDLNGLDAAHKLSILVHEAFGVDLDPAEIPTSGITGSRASDIQASDRAGSTLRLMARARRTGDDTVNAEVVAEYRPHSDPCARIQAEENHLRVKASNGAVLEILGRGAGRCPTATSVFADLDDLYRIRVLGRLEHEECPQALEVSA